MVGACEEPDESTVTLSWTEVTLSAAGPERLALRDAVACGGRWYVVGAVVAADGTTRPAAWTSGDGRSWSPVQLVAHTLYGESAVLYAAGCREGLLAALGAKSGGAHGNPRISQWRPRSDRRLEEVRAPFELYGGPDAVNVARIAGGPPGWLITGNRVRGAAVWVSADGANFQLVAGLAGDGELATEALDATAYQEKWVVVGGGRRAGSTDSEPLAWTSVDGLRWRRTAVPAADGRHQVVQRVTGYGNGLVAAGVAGERFAAWTLREDRWRPAGRFGQAASGGVHRLTGLVAAGDRLWAAGTDGRAYRLWMSADGGDSWRPARLPVGLAAGGADRAMTVAAAGSVLLVVADDGQRGRTWAAGG